jgi:hypothetical protein
MNATSQTKTFDTEIIETSHRIERLTTEGAPYEQIEEAQYKLSRLVEQKRQGIYQPKDPSYFIDQFMACLTPEDRRKKAAELAEGALASINAIEESQDTLDPVQLETFISIVEFFRYFAAKNDERVYDADDDDSASLIVPELPVVPIEANVLSKITPQHLAAALVEYGYLTEENARLFIHRISGLKSGLPDKIPIAWQGDIHSAATMFTLASTLNILYLGSKKNPNAEEIRTTIASAVLHTFSFTIDRPLNDKNYKKLVYRHSKEAKESVGTFFDAVKYAHIDRARNQNLGKQIQDKKVVKPLEDVAEIICEYYNLCQIRGIGESIQQQARFMDFQVLDAFNDLIMSE